MLDVLNKHFQNLLSPTKTHRVSFQTAFFMAYFVPRLAGGADDSSDRLPTRYPAGLVILATGAFLFIPAGPVFKTFWCVSLRVVSFFATGLACIETAANPTSPFLVPRDGAPGRLSVAQAFNPAPIFWHPPWRGSAFGNSGCRQLDFHPLLLYIVPDASCCHLRRLFADQIARHWKPTPSKLRKARTTGPSPPARQTAAFHARKGFTQFLYIISQIGIGAFAVNYILENAIVTDASGVTKTAPLFEWYGS